MTKAKLAVIGSGPAALMAADVLASAGYPVDLFEKRPGIAWKLFVAGGSGLNISNNWPMDRFVSCYTGPVDIWRSTFSDFFTADWIRFIEEKLELGTFLGTSGRYFVETMHAAKMVRNWKRRLENLGVVFHTSSEIQDFEKAENGYRLSGLKDDELYEALFFGLGGASYEKQDLRWPKMFLDKGIGFQPFEPSNTGYEVAWSKAFLEEAEGQALKNIKLTNSRGERRGDMVITNYGLEGTPIYFLGQSGPASIDLKPDLSEEALREKLGRTREMLAPIRRAKRYGQLNKAALALLFHMAPPDALQSVESLCAVIKNFPIDLLQPRALEESISARGGVRWENLDEGLMLRAFPNVYLAGEMLDWDAPTGGFLIQGSVAQGFRAARHFLQRSNQA